MDLLIALVVAAAVLAAGLAVAPRGPSRTTAAPAASFIDRAVARRAQELRTARLHVDPRLFTVACWATPPAVVLVGLVLGSPVVAVVGGGLGLALPRGYLGFLVGVQRRRTEAEAPRMLHVVLASLSAGGTYLEALEEARGRATDRWLRDDLDHIIGQFHLDVPLEASIAEVRARAAGRNLGLIWDNLAICIANRIPAARARGLLAELSSTIQFNVQMEAEVKARTSGQRVQIWMLAAIVPALFLYLRLVNADFFRVLDETAVGRYILFPLAVGLEILGVTLSFRLSRVEL